MSRTYGAEPTPCGLVRLDCPEMLFYQDMPIKFPGDHKVVRESRLEPFDGVIGKACGDFVGAFGLDRYMASFVYISAKRLFQGPECTFNRQGWHCDGFGTDDINYIAYDVSPTVFNLSKFNLPEDDVASMTAMQLQALPTNDRTYDCLTLLRLDQFCVHRTAVPDYPELRTFVKVSISRDKYNLEGNTHNPLLNYNWHMRRRGFNRNMPQAVTP